MKKLIIILLVTVSCQISSAQHYGGININPLWTINNGSFYTNSNAMKDLTFGYSIGYQGLIMPQRRFSFSYGLQYAYQFIEYKNLYEQKPNIVGRREELRSLEIPATWRYNILKNKKFQPYVSISTTLVIPVSHNRYNINEDGEKELFMSEPYGPYISPDFGVGFSVMRKF